MLKQVEPTLESPEALLRALDLELASRRAKRGGSERQRLIVLAGGLFVLLAASAIAFFVLFNMVSDLPRHQGGPGSEAVSSAQP